MGHGHPNGTRARGVGMDAPAFATGQLEDNQQGRAGPEVLFWALNTACPCSVMVGAEVQLEFLDRNVRALLS